MRFSFEFFPPKSEQGLKNLKAEQKKLIQLNPQYCSITYGAGGSTRDRTLRVVRETKAEFSIPTVPHLSCIGDNAEDITQLLDIYKAEGIQKIVALRGDLPSGTGLGHSALKYGVDLVKFIRAHSGDHFKISVAAYPEVHPQALSADQDFDNFKAKIDAGANEAITQYFYNLDAYCDFVERAEAQSIKTPISAGIMPITNYEKLARFSNMCGAEIPRWIKMRLEGYANANDTQSLVEFGRDFVTELCDGLLEVGAPSLHFYTLNQAEPTIDIIEGLYETMEQEMAER